MARITALRVVSYRDDFSLPKEKGRFESQAADGFGLSSALHYVVDAS